MIYKSYYSKHKLFHRSSELQTLPPRTLSKLKSAYGGTSIYTMKCILLFVVSIANNKYIYMTTKCLWTNVKEKLNKKQCCRRDSGRWPVAMPMFSQIETTLAC